MEWDDIYLEGYWQTEKYFRAVSGQVRKAYDTDRLLSYIEETDAEETEEKLNADLFSDYIQAVENNIMLFYNPSGIFIYNKDGKQLDKIEGTFFNSPVNPTSAIKA